MKRNEELDGEKAFRTGYVEEAISAEKEKIGYAYLSIDIAPKTGYEKASDTLRKYLKNMPRDVGMKKFFDDYKGIDIVLTDEDIPIGSEKDLFVLMNAISGKDILVHLRVNADDVSAVKDHLDAAAKNSDRNGMALLKWRQNDQEYLLELMKLLPDWSHYVLRLYEDANGVLIYSSGDLYFPHYFRLQEELFNELRHGMSEKIDYIVNHPEYIGEDDRFFGFSVHLRYNIDHKYPEARSRLQKGQVFDSIEYSDYEMELEIAKLLVTAPEIRGKWMKMHV